MSSSLRLAGAIALSLVVAAQDAFSWPMPRIPKEEIPDDMPPEIRKHVEGLYDIRDDNVCIASAKALGEMGPAAAPAAPFLASVLDRHKTCPTPNAAMESLVRIGKASVEPTLLALKVGDRYGRSRAICVLRELKDPRAIPGLIGAIADGLCGRGDIAALVEMGGTEELMSMATNSSPEVRQVAMRVLPLLTTPAAAHALANALGDTNEKVRQLATYGINDFLERNPSTPVPATNRILSAMSAPDAETRRLVLKVVARLNMDPEVKTRAMAPLLTDQDSGVLCQALASLALLKTHGSVELMSRAATNNDPLVRAALAGALGDTSLPSAVPVVESLISDEVGIVRERAVGAIASLKGRDAAQRITGIAMSDSDPMVRRRALQLLCGWRSIEVLPHLLTVLNDRNESVRLTCVDVAGAFGTNALTVLVHGLTNGFEKVREHAAATIGQNARPSRELASALLPFLDSPFADSRARVISLLARDASLIGDIDRVAAAIEDPDTRVKLTAISILGQRRYSGRIEALKTAARGADQSLAVAAVSALASLGDVPSLSEATRHRADQVRQAAMDGLEGIATAEARNALSEARKTRSWPVTRPAAPPTVTDESARLATPEMIVASLKTAGGRCPPAVRSRIVGMGTNVTHLLLAMVTNEPPALRSEVIGILAQTGDQCSVPALINAVRDPSAQVRESAVAALGSIHQPSAVAALCAALSDDTPAVTEQAVQAIGSIASPASLPGLLAMTNNPDFRMRAMIMRAVARIDDARSFDAIREALQDPHWHVRGTAIEALGATGNRKAIPDLIAALGDSHWSVRTFAAASLRSLSGRDFGQSGPAWKEWWNNGQPLTPMPGVAEKGARR